MSLDNVEIYLVDNFKTATQMMKWFESLEPDTVMGFDTETTGLDIYSPDARLRMVQIGDENHGWAVPWERWGGVVLEAIDSWEGRFSAHNLAFDYRVMLQLADYRLPWERFDDTMIMAQILAPGAPAGLKDLTDKYIDPRASQGEKELKAAFKNNGWNWATIPYNFPSYWYYSALDPVLASRLNRKLGEDIKPFYNIYDLEYAVRRVCAEIEHTGMRVDLDYVRQKHIEFSETVDAHHKEAEERWGINIGSTPQLAEKFKEMNAQFSFFTPKGSPSVNEDQLKEFMSSDNEEVSTLAKYVVEAKKMSKIDSTYFLNFLEMNVDGVLHPNIRTMGARTGRMSVTSPALQTLPSGDSLVRSAFISRNEGETLISCDYSQVEMRLLTHYSQDESLITAFRTADETGSDFFTEMGRMVFNDPTMDKEDKRRKLIKTFVYGLLYGASIERSARTVGVPIGEMEAISDAIHKRFPGINKFMNDSIKMGELRYQQEGQGYVLLDSGRKLPADDNRIYSLSNYKLQGTAAELMKLAVLRLDAAGLGPYIQMIIHDEVIFSIPDEQVEYWMPIIEDCMSYVDGEFAVDLLAEPEILGKRWGDGDKYQ